MNILITGFRPFGQHSINPTETAVTTISANRMANHNIKTFIFDTSYSNCDLNIPIILKDDFFDLVVLFGVSFSTEKFKIERVALNIDDAKTADNENVTRKAGVIAGNGDAAIFSTINLSETINLFTDNLLDATISNHAGTFICNHAYYQALYTAKTLGLKCKIGMIHVPPLQEQILPKHKIKKGADLSGIIKAMELCINNPDRLIKS